MATLTPEAPPAERLDADTTLDTFEAIVDAQKYPCRGGAFEGTKCPNPAAWLALCSCGCSSDLCGEHRPIYDWHFEECVRRYGGYPCKVHDSLAAALRWEPIR